jgi:hypothetical protein
MLYWYKQSLNCSMHAAWNIFLVMHVCRKALKESTGIAQLCF